jgi:hypothetical protein
MTKKRTRFLLLVGLMRLLVVVVVLLLKFFLVSAYPPNILFILADDLGIGEVEVVRHV